MANSGQVIAILFADIEGYSGVSDDELYGRLSDAAEEFARRHLTDKNHVIKNTWGDAFFICSYDPIDIAEIALDLRDYYRNLNWKRMGLSKPLGIRIGLHLGRVTAVTDGAEVLNVVGVNVNAAARIEPVVPVNQVYCSEALWLTIRDDPRNPFLGTAIGKKELAKSFGEMSLYHLMRAHDEDENVAQEEDDPVAGSAVDEQQELVLVTRDQEVQLLGLERVRKSDRLQIEVRPGGANGEAFLQSLQVEHRLSIGVAWGLSAGLYDVAEVSQQWEDGESIWSLDLEESGADYGSGWMEASFSNFSADDIAELRARRILLDEQLDRGAGGGGLNQSMLESMVRGQGGSIDVEKSPLPDLGRHLLSQPELLVASARLTAVLWLRLSGTVEVIQKLDVQMMDGPVLAVAFEGRRSKRYNNVDPCVIRVEGTCPLRSDA